LGGRIPTGRGPSHASPEALCDPPYRPTGGNATRDLFALLKPQRYRSSPAWRWSNSSIESQDPIDAALVPPLKHSGDVRHTLTALPALPGLSLLLRREPAGQPHHLDIAPSFTLKSAGLTARERGTRKCKASAEPKDDTKPAPLPREPLHQTQARLVDEGINHPNRIVLINPVLQTLRKQRRLRAIYPLNEAVFQLFSCSPSPPECVNGGWHQRRLCV
jgi:hypothetical protein